MTRQPQVYTKSERINGVRVKSEDEVVTEEFVRTFTSAETRRFFASLGGTETFGKHPSGVIYLLSTSPNGEIHETVFTPLFR